MLSLLTAGRAVCGHLLEVRRRPFPLHPIKNPQLNTHLLGLTRSQHAFREDSLDKNLQTAVSLRTKEGEVANSKSKEDKENQAPEAVDPLEGMPQADKWGVKGLRTLMNNYPDYHTMVVGIDPGTLGVDITSPEYV